MKYLAIPSSIFFFFSSSSTGELCSQPVRGNVRVCVCEWMSEWVCLCVCVCVCLCVSVCVWPVFVCARVPVCVRARARLHARVVMCKHETASMMLIWRADQKCTNKRDYGTAITPGPFFTSPVETITDGEGQKDAVGYAAVQLSQSPQFFLATSRAVINSDLYVSGSTVETRRLNSRKKWSMMASFSSRLRVSDKLIRKEDSVDTRIGTVIMSANDCLSFTPSGKQRYIDVLLFLLLLLFWTPLPAVSHLLVASAPFCA